MRVFVASWSNRLGYPVAVCVWISLAILLVPTDIYGQNTRPGSPQPRALKDAATLLEAGRLDEAETAVRAYLVSAPRDANGHTLLGVILDQSGRQAEAEQSYNTALKLDSNNVAA